ncbi:hypothetical protein [Aliivibrio fischeri]|uniref:hypothetical protein n=1 Tax=Aliivibrio fischeri TaxID=668 RepID=UPI0007C57F5C|nr:hypothetical protein [Aliivibrio fischeri]
MARILPIENAKQLIEFIDNTNYELAPHGDGIFNSKQEAMAFVESEQYSPKEALSVCFETLKGDYWDSIVVTYEDGVWSGVDHSIGGHSMTGDTIEEMLISYRELHDLSCQYSPMPLIMKHEDLISA